MKMCSMICVELAVDYFGLSLT